MADSNAVRDALEAAKACILIDRTALADTHFDAGLGRVDDEGQAGLDEYDAALAKIDATLSQGAEPAKLPHDVTVGHTTFRKGVSLETFVEAARRWHRIAYPLGYELTDEQKAENLRKLQAVAAPKLASTPDHEAAKAGLLKLLDETAVLPLNPMASDTAAGAAPKPGENAGAWVDYEPAYEFARTHRLSFNEVASMVRHCALAATPPADTQVPSLGDFEAWLLREFGPNYKTGNFNIGQVSRAFAAGAALRTPAAPEAGSAPEPSTPAAVEALKLCYNLFQTFVPSDQGWNSMQTKAKQVVVKALATPQAQLAAALLSIDHLIAKYHAEVWAAAEGETSCDYDMAGVETAKQLRIAIAALVGMEVSKS